LLLDLGIFWQFFLYRSDEDGVDEERTASLNTDGLARSGDAR
jgi:hypothetical protein